MKTVATALIAALISLGAAASLADAAEAQTVLGWDVPCNFTRSIVADPIVFPGQPGAGHLHDFMNNKPTAYTTTKADFLALAPNCQFAGGTHTGDRSGYWVPALYDSAGAKAVVDNVKVYMRVGRDVDPMDVRAFASGTEIVAGQPHATGPQVAADGRQIVTWRCGGAGNGATKNGSALPPSCPDDLYPHVIAQVRFPDCSDGRREADDHRSHMAYSVAGVCPPTHPRHVPQLFLDVAYDLRNGEGATLSSNPDNAYGYHGDFFEGWEPGAAGEPGRLAELIVSCIRSGVGCGPDGRP